MFEPLRVFEPDFNTDKYGICIWQFGFVLDWYMELYADFGDFLYTSPSIR